MKKIRLKGYIFLNVIYYNKSYKKLLIKCFNYWKNISKKIFEFVFIIKELVMCFCDWCLLSKV